MTAANLALLRLTVGGVDYTGEVGKAVIGSAETRPEDVRRLGAPPRRYYLNLALIVDHAEGSLWRQVFELAYTKADIVVMPYGNEVPSAGEPHYAGVAEIREPDGDLMGGTADKRRRKRQNIDVQWPLDAKPTAIYEPA